MTIMSTPLPTYLARIGLTGPVGPDLESLCAIHTAHAGTIPFENIDIQADPPRPIRVDEDGIFAKLVGEGRGGYCFEQNGLLFRMLGAIGFDVRRCLARVVWNSPVMGARTHLIVLVTLGGQDWIADCGFGGYGLVAPLRVAPGEVQEIHGESWRVIPSDRMPGLEIQVRLEGEWRPAYIVDPAEPVVDADILAANHFTQSFPESRFVLNRIAALNRPGQRLSLLNREVKLRRGGEVTVRTLSSDAEVVSVLRADFGLALHAGFRLKELEPA
jgi:N-hydroxyarylamine O-acetyltransferase